MIPFSSFADALNRPLRTLQPSSLEGTPNSHVLDERQATVSTAQGTRSNIFIFYLVFAMFLQALHCIWSFHTIFKEALPRKNKYYLSSYLGPVHMEASQPTYRAGPLSELI